MKHFASFFNAWFFARNTFSHNECMNGKRLRFARSQAGLSQTELGEAVGLSQSMVGYLERGEREPSIDTVKALAATLKVGVQWLLGESVAEETRVYGPERLLADRETPPGLRDLASDRALVEALAITPEEWRALRSIDLPGPTPKAGYLNLLTTIRAVCGSGGPGRLSHVTRS